MSKMKTGLGKGLSALIGPSEPEVSVSEAGHPLAPVGSISGSTVQIDITKIRPNPLQPRADFDQQALDELKESIRQKGIIQPVTVRPAAGGGGMYELITGERRIRASLEIGLKAVPAYILDVKTDEEMLELALIENLQREHLNPIEIAISYQRLMQDVGLTAEHVARKVSKDRTTIVNFLRLLKLPVQIQDALRKLKITMGHARALINISDQALQVKLFERILKNDLNVRQVEKLVRDTGKKQEKKPAGKLSKRAGTVEENLAERIQQILATRVRISTHDEGRGEIIIEFYSHDDLGRLFDMLSSIEH